jgi:carbamoyltransferase
MAFSRTTKVKKRLEMGGVAAPLSVIDHHVSHLASAYFTSGWDRCIAMSLDAQGDGYCCRVALCENGTLNLLHSVPFFHSPGYFYAYVTAILGFKPRRDGKVTGLAALGEPSKTRDVFQDRISYDSEKMRFDNHGAYWNLEIDYLRNRLSGCEPADIAAGVQAQLESVVTSYVKDVLSRHGLSDVNLAVAGGVFANVKLNQRLAEMSEISQLYVFPHMGDGGLPVGSALVLTARMMAKQDGRLTPYRVSDVYLGPSHDNGEILKALEAAGCTFSRPDNIHDEIAGLVAEEKVVARFRGAMEYGPRALGHRSILACPVDPSINQRLNQKLKRTEFMPFAPVVLFDHASDYFEGLSEVEASTPYMTVTCNVTEKCWLEAPGIVHKDGTARPQVVRPEQNPDMCSILNSYKRLTGLPLMINTSFNIHEEPIVCNPIEAIAAWRIGALDALAIGDYLVTR